MSIPKYLRTSARPAVVGLETIQARLSANLCTRCGSKAEPGKAFCGPCWTTGDFDGVPVLAASADDDSD